MLVDEQNNSEVFLTHEIQILEAPNTEREAMYKLKNEKGCAPRIDSLSYLPTH